ncbi:acyltransferase family protein [Actinorugispora endophytica]|uniref:Acyltransferase-like protein n=1 Tax=Actinorugispora endophytica TaxID=1605990 RepID=A0A4R6VBZ5_9ACTN|nr:acyltransferase family protein [Actinorugispora endophytica]TDQ54256.1 acyltransferase-like protein [Actinorugispora endophytica]
MSLVLDPGVLRASPPPSPPGAGAERDLFLDALRLFVIALVVLQHWLMPVLSYSGQTLGLGSVLTAPGAFTLTWVAQVMPLIFFVGGTANAMSWGGVRRRGGTLPGWLARRLRRLAWPVVPLAATWLVLSSAYLVWGAPEQPFTVAAKVAAIPLWFLAAYLMVVALTPLAGLAERRYGWWAPAALLAAAVAVDLLRFTTGVSELGYLNVAFVWIGVYQLGFRYAGGALTRTPSLVMTVCGFGIAIALAAFGPYSLNMTGVFAVEASNVNPPTLVLAALAAGQIGTAMLLRGRILAWTDHRLPVRLLDWARPRLMTVYLWHLVPMAVFTGVAVVGAGVDTPSPFGLAWLGWSVLGIVVMTPMLWPLVQWTARFEEPPRVAYGSPGLVRVIVAGLLIAGGLLTLTIVGFQAGVAPLSALLALVVGLLLTWTPIRFARRAGTAAAGG